MSNDLLYPIGESDFANLRQDGALYVDKTQLIRTLVTRGRYYFLSRPRRFGKSLLVSTLKAYFQGREDLFQGLAIEGKVKKEEAYPVLHIDLSPKTYDSPEALAEHLNYCLRKCELQLQLPINTGMPADERFLTLIDDAQAKTGRQVVVLIDEYDAPLLETIANPQLQEIYRRQLSGFYKVLKAQTANLRFVFLTGITRFSKLSIFSAINNLLDISLSADYATLCGITQQELETYFPEGLKALQEALQGEQPGITMPEVLQRLKEKYDGYHFSPRLLAPSDGVYNPYSLLSALMLREVQDYWYATATPSYLADVLELTHYSVSNLLNRRITMQALGDVALTEYDPRPIFYQSGYLTLESFSPVTNNCGLRIPNGEVEHGLYRFLMGHFSQQAFAVGHQYDEEQLVDLLEQGKVEEFMAKLVELFNTLDYLAMNKEKENSTVQKDQRKKAPRECDFQGILYILFSILGFYPHIEVRMAWGRADMLVETPAHVYVFEFKVDSSPETALQQITDQGYDVGIPLRGRQLHCLGVNFNRAKGIIEGWKAQESAE